jgi:hypothetical protein
MVSVGMAMFVAAEVIALEPEPDPELGRAALFWTFFEPLVGMHAASARRVRRGISPGRIRFIVLPPFS